MRNTSKQIESQNNANFNGNAVDFEQVYSASFMVVFSDAATTGTLKFQASNDPAIGGNMASFVPTNWVDIPSASSAVVAGGSILISLGAVSYRWVRPVWTRTAGAGTVKINMNSQGV